MIEKENLRKMDVYSGIAFFLFGLWIVVQAFKMPMRDSWGGVMNVWYVSPALFPLFIGLMIMLLGSILCGIALYSIGMAEFKMSLRWLMSSELFRTLTGSSAIRFYGIAILFLTLVYLNLPRVDFFICALTFLIVFITMFIFFDDSLLRKLLFLYVLLEAVLLVYFGLGIEAVVTKYFQFATDLLSLFLLVIYSVYARTIIGSNPVFRKKYRTGLIVAVIAPFVIGSVFKYFLMVPLPKEGIVVTAIDYIWYFEFLK
jgi:hypothetical protein